MLGFFKTCCQTDALDESYFGHCTCFFFLCIVKILIFDSLGKWSGARKRIHHIESDIRFMEFLVMFLHTIELILGKTRNY